MNNIDINFFFFHAGGFSFQILNIHAFFDFEQ